VRTTVPTTLDGSLVAALAHRLSEVDTARAARYPGDAGGRQPVHTCYVPADAVTPDLPAEWGAAALAALRAHAPGPHAFAEVLGLPVELAEPVHEKVIAKLGREPVEDLRIDFEDGYGLRAEEVEDDDAVRCAGLAGGFAVPWVGIRFKSFDTTELFERGIRTLDLFVTALGAVPPGFVLTFPKVTAVEQVTALCELLDVLEERLELAAGTLRFEIQIETTQSIVDSSGAFAIPTFLGASQGRVSGLHFGTYDYTAACGLSATDQHLAHAACDFARNVMQVSAAGTGVRLSDGSTNILPVGDREDVHEGWRTHFGLVLRSLSHGFYQGWDLHPAQLVTRYAANYAFHLGNAAANARRLRAYVAKADEGVLDEPATAQALAMSMRRALDCGALSAADVEELCGLSEAELGALVRREP
jgi:citrate lyase beta subunit